MGTLAPAAPADGQRLDAGAVSEFHWRLLGPASPAGRAWKVVGLESDPHTFYVTTAGGGLWKTTNDGTTLVPVLDGQRVASTGHVAVAATDPDLVWVGTGEPASTRANSWGNGVYKSMDGGRSWAHMGLDETREISKVVIDPSDPDRVYVAAMGQLWGSNPERGIFMTADAGETWEKILFVDDTTGFIDLEMDPHDPATLYAAAWQRYRYGGGDMDEAGAGSGIYKTTDGGRSWTRLGRGLPTDDMGKIKLAVARNDSDIVYAAILAGEPAGRGQRTSDQGGIFRSLDGGTSWERVNDMATNYYYQHLYVDPSDDETLWMPVFDLWRSTDGGRTFEKRNLTHVHNDLHGMWIDPHDPEHLVIVGDGGVNVSFDRGETWIQPPLPIGQFYAVDVDDQDPYHVYGGMQDTGHWTGPSRTYDAEGITNHDWIKLRITGDGMAIHPDPRDPNILYMVQQFGNFSRLDLRTWERTELKPDPDDAERRGLHPFRYNWTPPMLVSHHDPDVLYLGSNYLFRYSEQGARWDVISDDLSRQQDRVLQGVRDGHHSYGTLFALAESHYDPRVLWTGANDGPVHVTRDLGRSWTDVTANFPRGTPTEAVVSWIETSRHAPGTAYLVYDNHTREDVRPHLFRTRDWGVTWTRITGDLPDDAPVYVVREDPVKPGLLYAGTEFGAYFTLDGGRHWTPLKGNLPPVAVRSMVLQPRAKELVVGTFGRSIWAVDIAPLQELSPELLDNEALHLFQPQPAIRFNPRYTYGATIEQLNGDMFFRAENPPYGTMISYYVRDDLGGEVQLTIRDSAGTAVRRLSGPGTPGIHRVNWDLARDEPPTPAELQRSEAVTATARVMVGRVPIGRYEVLAEGAGLRLRRTIEVRPEPEGLQHVKARL